MTSNTFKLLNHDDNACILTPDLTKKIHENCLKKHRVSAKILLSLNKHLLGKETLWNSLP
jgi:hypothetical protein